MAILPSTSHVSYSPIYILRIRQGAVVSAVLLQWSVQHVIWCKFCISYKHDCSAMKYRFVLQAFYGYRALQSNNYFRTLWYHHCSSTYNILLMFYWKKTRNASVFCEIKVLASEHGRCDLMSIEYSQEVNLGGCVEIHFKIISYKTVSQFLRISKCRVESQLNIPPKINFKCWYKKHSSKVVFITHECFGTAAWKSSSSFFKTLSVGESL